MRAGGGSLRRPSWAGHGDRTPRVLGFACHRLEPCPIREQPVREHRFLTRATSTGSSASAPAGRAPAATPYDGSGVRTEMCTVVFHRSTRNRCTASKRRDDSRSHIGRFVPVASRGWTRVVHTREFGDCDVSGQNCSRRVGFCSAQSTPPALVAIKACNAAIIRCRTAMAESFRRSSGPPRQSASERCERMVCREVRHFLALSCGMRSSPPLLDESSAVSATV